MRTSIPSTGTISRGYRFAPATVAFGLLLVLGLAPSGFAQAPLNFENNFFVTGDYVVGGAYGMNEAENGWATGTIRIPDGNPGIQPASTANCVINGRAATNCVPAGAEVLAALLYWQTVENVNTVPGKPGSGQNGFFRPLFFGGPDTGYPLNGVYLGSQPVLSSGSGGCTGNPTTQVVRTYRAPVIGYMQQDPKTGSILPNGTYQVTLPSSGYGTPNTLGATLVIIYRIISPNVPLNSIVIYDGAAGPGSGLPIKEFYQAADNPVVRLTHIVGNGHGNKYQTVSLDSVQLPSLYGHSAPAFPGYYDGWDNPTWTFPNPNVPNPISGDSTSATTMVVPTTSNKGCVSWGAVIFSTTVKSTSGDGLLDIWKTGKGYCDASANINCSGSGDAAWVPLADLADPPTVGRKDVFVQLDYVYNSVTGNSFNPGLATDPVLSPVVTAFKNQGIHLHIVPGNTINEALANQTASSLTCADDHTTNPPTLCPYPGQPGVVGWKGGLIFIKNQLIDPSTGNFCTTAFSPADCMPVLQPAKKDSYHYALFAHAIGLPTWSLGSKTLTSVVQVGHTVAFTTSTPHGLGKSDGFYCANGRVTVAYAITNPNLNGTFCVNSVLSPTTFTIQVANSSIEPYYFQTDPDLEVGTSQAGTVSGFSDVGGQDSVIALGNWGADATTQVKTGTFMHELGHSLGLTHGGFYYDKIGQNPPDYTPTVEANCKSNHQSVMNYMFQIDLLGSGTGNLPDYSGQTLNPLNKLASPPLNPLGATPTYLNTSWHGTNVQLGIPVGTPLTLHCDGSPITDGAMVYRVTRPASSFTWMAGQDIDFDGNTKTESSLRGYNDWGPNGTLTTGVDMRQIGATGSLSAAGLFGGGKVFGGGGGKVFGGGGGQQFGAGGGKVFGGGGGKQFGAGGGKVFGGGGGLGEITQTVANSFTRPPTGLGATEGASPRTITLSWTAPNFGQIGAYKIYRSENGGAFIPVATVTGTVNPPAPPATTYTDTVTCDAGGYRYYVTAVLQNTTQESVPSNTVSTILPDMTDKLTGCYILTNFSSPPSAVHGSLVPISWQLQDDFYPTNGLVTVKTANTLVAIGPLPATSCATNGPTTILASQSLLAPSGPGLFTFNWDTDTFCAGSYTFQLTLDSGQTQTTTTPLQLQVDVNDTDSTPHVTTTSLPPATVGVAYSNTLTQHGGTPPLTWNFSGTLPAGISGNSAGILSGTACTAGPSSFMVTVSDSKLNSGTQGLTLQVNQANTTTSVSSNATPAVYGQAITFTVTVAPNSPCPPPTGTVTLSSELSQIGSNSLSGGTTTFTTSLPVGTHSITASYGGDGNFIHSTSAPLVQVVNKASTTTSVTSNVSPSVFGQAVTFTATVSPVAPGAGAPSGMVNFFDGATQIGSGTVTGGVAGFSTTVLAVATHNITATYVGDGNFVTSTSATFSQTVNKATTTTSVASGPNPSVYGQAVTFTATVSPVAPGAGAPSGTVNFFDGGAMLIGSAAVSNGTAMFTTTSSLPFGVNSITATYSGDGNFIGSTSASLSQTVMASTTTSVVSNPNPAVFGQPVTFTATVSPVSPGVGSPSGTVNFLDGAATIGSGPVTNGVASFTTSALAVGFHSITANYPGDTLFVGSASSSITVPVQAVVTNTADTGAGSLRQAILDVNAQSGPQPLGIVFNISSGTVSQTIAPGTPLPTLTQPTALDGTTQPGYAGTPLIELDGSSIVGASVAGLHIAAGNSTVRGLNIHNFSGDGILIDTNGSDVIQGNYIGTNPTGTTAMPNGGNGMQIIDTPNNTVGGSTSSMRNVISGNTGEGVRIDGALATLNTVQGNYIGTDASGLVPVGNSLSGIYIRRAPGNSLIGNVVSSNLGNAGITICGNTASCGGGDNLGPGTPGNNASGNIVQGNFVGTNFNGTPPLGNSGAGLSIDGAPNTQVGGTTANVISFNGSNDVQIFDPGAGGNLIQGNTIQGSTTATTTGIAVDVTLTGNTLSQNSILGHTGLGIDTYPASGVVNLNQPGVAPVISSAQLATTTIAGTLNSTANTTFTIEFFSNTSCNASGYGEGATFLGPISVTTDATGFAPISFQFPGLVATNLITATSTDINGTTSEFSNCVTPN